MATLSRQKNTKSLSRKHLPRICPGRSVLKLHWVSFNRAPENLPARMLLHKRTISARSAGSARRSAVALQTTDTRFPPRFVGKVYSNSTNRSDESFWGAVKRFSVQLQNLRFRLQRPLPNDRSLRTDGVHGNHFTVGWTESVGGTHRLEHGVVNIQTLGSDGDDLARLEATLGAGDRVKDA